MGPRQKCDQLQGLQDIGVFSNSPPRDKAELFILRSWNLAAVTGLITNRGIPLTDSPGVINGKVSITILIREVLALINHFTCFHVSRGLE